MYSGTDRPVRAKVAPRPIYYARSARRGIVRGMVARNHRCRPDRRRRPGQRRSFGWPLSFLLSRRNSHRGRRTRSGRQGPERRNAARLCRRRAAFTGPVPKHVESVRSLDRLLVLSFKTASARFASADARCDAARGFLAALRDEKAGGFVFHPYPVTPYHADYLHHLDRVETAINAIGGASAPAASRRSAPKACSQRRSCACDGNLQPTTPTSFSRKCRSTSCSQAQACHLTVGRDRRGRKKAGSRRIGCWRRHSTAQHGRRWMTPMRACSAAKRLASQSERIWSGAW